jgi:hypothetical protein
MSHPAIQLRYDQFWTALQARKPKLKDLFPNGPIEVEWGHQLSPNKNPVRDDHKLTEVERFVKDQVSYRSLEHHSGPNKEVQIMGQSSLIDGATSGYLRMVCDVESKRLLQKGERGLVEACNVAMWMIWESGSKSLREIGELFSGLDYAAVAQRIRRTRSAHDAQTNRKLLKEILNVET